MMVNVKARVTLGSRDAVFAIGVEEGILGDLISRHEAEWCFLDGLPEPWREDCSETDEDGKQRTRSYQR